MSVSSNSLSSSLEPFCHNPYAAREHLCISHIRADVLRADGWLAERLAAECRIPHSSRCRDLRVVRRNIDTGCCCVAVSNAAAAFVAALEGHFVEDISSERLVVTRAFAQSVFIGQIHYDATKEAFESFVVTATGIPASQLELRWRTHNVRQGTNKGHCHILTHYEHTSRLMALHGTECDGISAPTGPLVVEPARRNAVAFKACGAPTY